jgi:hypothetical protein
LPILFIAGHIIERHLNLLPWYLKKVVMSSWKFSRPSKVTPSVILHARPQQTPQASSSGCAFGAQSTGSWARSMAAKPSKTAYFPLSAVLKLLMCTRIMWETLLKIDVPKPFS